MRVFIIASLLLVCALDGMACPEIVVPVNRKDTALRSARWKTPLQAYKNRQYKSALLKFRRTAKAIDSEMQTLFHPKDAVVANRTIQKWLQRHMYTRYPSILEAQDGFTFPVLVWWAWADTACRQGKYQEAERALNRLAALRPSSDVQFHQVVVAIHRHEWKRAKSLLAKTRPDRYLTPWAEGVLAGQRGDFVTAKNKLQRAADGAYTKERRQAALQALKRWGTKANGDDSPDAFR